MNKHTLQNIALSVTNERSSDKVLHKIVQGLAEDKDIALARVWLKEEGDVCDSCPAAPACGEPKVCLHLTASAGSSIVDKDETYSFINGSYRRIPFGERKIGRIGRIGEPELHTDVQRRPAWLKDPAWVNRERIMSFAGQPLIFHGEILGVIAIFSRQLLNSASLTILRSFADNAAASIVNAHAFEEIHRLQRQLELENEYLREEVKEVRAFGDILGESPALHKTLEQIEMVAPTEATVLIEGESGVGKELIARAIHERSSRKDRQMIKINCASIPKDLFESEFFGHVRGAFSGAIRDRTGRFPLADKGTVFLDEVGEIPLELQSKLLRILQEGEFERVGEDRTQKVDVRIIAATNRNLKKEVNDKTFREDLYFRLSVFPIDVAPLRERKSDIPLIANEFIHLACIRLGVPEIPLKEKHVIQLMHYDWPGNVRELQNVIERAVILARGRSLRFDFPNSDKQGTTFNDSPSPNDSAIETYEELKEQEKTMIFNALKEAKGKISGTNGAAELLGIKPTTLISRMKAMGIKNG